MKKTILTILMSLLLFVGFSQNSVVTVQGGYSWLNGVIGTELQFGSLGISAGYMPTVMPLSGDPVSSYSLAFTLYGKNYDESCLYGSFGIASAGYRYEDSSGESIVESMSIGMIGYRYATDFGFSSKLGAGYGWNKHTGVYTVEWTLGYSF